jgi:hypothetical protein
MALQGEAKKLYNVNYNKKNKKLLSEKNKKWYQDHKDWLKIRRILPIGLFF